MATVGTLAVTLADWASRVQDDKIATVIEVLNQTNEVLDDMRFLESNSATGHKTTVRSGLPAVTWRLLNYGVAKGKSKTVQVTDSFGMLEAYSEVDKSLADLNGDTAAFRMSEDSAFIESMSQEFASTLFYGNTKSDPEEFMGLSPRYNAVSGAENSENVIDASGTGSVNTSIWLVVWGDRTVHGIFPKGQKAGLQFKDLGEHTATDANGGYFQVYRSHYKWDCGLTLRDWRYVVRICNIDVTTLTKNAASGADLIDKITDAIERIPNLGAGTPIIYANKTITSFLRRQVSNKVAANLTLDTFSGKRIVAFDGIPIRKCDALLNTEARVTT